MKKIIYFLILYSFVVGFSVNAHPGNTASDGCHYCRTNCSSWGQTYGARHCHGGGITSPSYPSYTPSYPTYTPSYPSYTPSYPTIPDCPLFSTYNSLTGQCKCNYGYVVDTNFLGDESCVSGYTYCTNKYGIHSSYDSLSKSCECDSGYYLKSTYSGYECVSLDSQCEDQYGYNADYDSLSGKCKCGYGYVFGEGVLGKTQCVSESSYCRDKLGFSSKYNSLTDSCECSYGYELSYKTFGSGYECKSCFTKYGLHSSYNALLKECKCDSGYTLKDGECVEKHNSAYFTLKEVDTSDREAIIESEYSGTCYLISYGIGCFSTTIRRYINDRVVINMGTDFYVDIWDWLVLHDDDQTCSITDVETVNCSHSLEESDFGSNAIIKFTPSTSIPASNNLSFVNQERALLSDIDHKFSDSLRGKILLQVESHGEAWYVHPETSKKHYMANGNEAYKIMRDLGVGIANVDLDKMKSDKVFAKKHSGKIFLQVEAHGEAYYIDFDGTAHYLKDGSAAYTIMRELGLGITNSDIRKIDVGEIN